jgi:hypothetical protein
VKEKFILKNDRDSKKNPQIKTLFNKEVELYPSFSIKDQSVFISCLLVAENGDNERFCEQYTDQSSLSEEAIMLFATEIGVRRAVGLEASIINIFLFDSFLAHIAGKQKYLHSSIIKGQASTRLSCSLITTKAQDNKFYYATNLAHKSNRFYLNRINAQRENSIAQSEDKIYFNQKFIDEIKKIDEINGMHDRNNNIIKPPNLAKQVFTQDNPSSHSENQDETKEKTCNIIDISKKIGRDLGSLLRKKSSPVNN